MNKSIKFFLIIALGTNVFFSLCSYADAVTYYVSKSGNDSNDGLSSGTAFLTVQKGVSAALAGDTVLISSGTYVEFVAVGSSGTSTQYITIRSAPSVTAILSAPSGAWQGVIRVQGKKYIKIQNLEIRGNSLGWGVQLEHDSVDSNIQTSYVELTNLLVHDNADANIEVRGNVNHVTISGCTLYNTSTTGGLDISGWPDSGTKRPEYIIFHDNVSYGNTGTPGAAYDSERADYLTGYNNIAYNSSIGMDMGSGVGNNFYNNTVHNCTDGIDISSNSNSIIHDNLIYNCNEPMYNYFFSGHMEPHTNNKYYNNIIHDSNYGIYESASKNYRGTYAGPSTNMSYYNNLFYNIGTSSPYRTPFYFQSSTGLNFDNNTIYMNAGLSALELSSGNSTIGCTGATIENNIFDLSGTISPIIVDSYSQNGLTLDYNNCYYRAGSGVCVGSHSVSGDPKFDSIASGNFQLISGSAAIDSGTTIMLFTTDLLGTSRPQGSAWDMGAYENSAGVRKPNPPANLTVN